MKSNLQLTIFILLYLLAYLLTRLLTPLSIRLARQIGALDYPDLRKVHQVPIPRLGGLAIAAGIWLTLLFGYTVNPTIYGNMPLFYGMLLGSVLIIALGIYDDVYNASPLLKLTVQFIAALIAIGLGTKFALATNPLAESVRDYFNLGIFAWPLSLIWIVGLTNAINLVDGLDGLATGIAMICSTALFLISMNQEAGIITFAYVAIAGSCMAFLRFNRFPARVFLGDTGSTFLGFTLACLSIQGSHKSYTLTALFIPLIVFGIPIFESISTLVRRYLTSQELDRPDSMHLHHRLLRIGLDQRQAVWILYSLTILLGIIGFTFTVLLDEYAAVILLIIGTLGGYMGRELKIFAGERRSMERQVRVEQDRRQS